MDVTDPHQHRIGDTVVSLVQFNCLQLFKTDITTKIQGYKKINDTIGRRFGKNMLQIGTLQYYIQSSIEIWQWSFGFK
jgi:hypothetical protein